MSNFDPEDVSYERNVRPIAEIKSQMVDLERVEALATSYGTPDFASRVGFTWINRHKRSLLNELRVSELLESGGLSEIAGTLISHDEKTRRFELWADGEKYRGVVSKSALAQLLTTPIGSEIKAQIKVVVTAEGNELTPPLVVYILEAIVSGPIPNQSV